MARRIDAPTTIPAPGEPPKVIEEFIGRVASHSMGGLPYQLPGEDGAEPERLSDWLGDRLAEHRSTAAGP